MGERGGLVTKIEEHDGYGWYFYTEVDGTRVWSMLQFCEPWLLIVEVPLRWLQRLKGKRVDEIRERACRDIHEVLKAMPQARNVPVVHALRVSTIGRPRWVAGSMIRMSLQAETVTSADDGGRTTVRAKHLASRRLLNDLPDALR